MKLHKNLKRALLAGVVVFATLLTSFAFHSTPANAAAVTLKGGPFYWVAEGQSQLWATGNSSSPTNTSIKMSIASGDENNTMTTPNFRYSFDAKGNVTITGIDTSQGVAGTATFTYTGADKDKVTDKSKLAVNLVFEIKPAGGTVILTTKDGPEDLTTPKKLADITSAVQATAADPCANATGLIGHYVLCPIAEFMLSSIKLFYNMIQPLLQVNPLTVNDPATNKPSAIYSVWDAIKNLSNIALVLIFFVIIFSQATSVGVSSYGIKKILPKLIIGAIAINLSFFVCSFLIDVFNILGNGIQGLVSLSLQNAGVKFGGIYSSDGFLGDQIGLETTIAVILIAIPLLIIIVLMFLLGVIILLFRQVLIVLLVVLSPLALAAWLLPNFEKYFSKWWTTFLKLLVVYPAIAILYAAVQIIQVLIGQLKQGTDPATGAVLLLGGMVVSALPLLLIFTIIKSTDQATRSVMNWMDTKRKQGQGLGKKAAMNTRYGQAYQQYMAGRKTTASLKGRDTLRGVLNKNPSLVGLMGGPGGGQHAARFLDTENRKHFAEQVANIRQGMTPNVGASIAKGDLARRVQSGYWKDASEWTRADGSIDKAAQQRARITDEDRSAIQKLHSQGYINNDYSPNQSPEMATALLGSVFDAEVAGPEVVQGLANQLKGASATENAMFTEALRQGASSKGYKNLQYADVSGGKVSQYNIKDPDAIVASGLRGINKDSLDAKGYNDSSLLDAIQRKAQRQGDRGRLEIIQQTIDIDKEGILAQLAPKLGMSIDELYETRQAIKTPSVPLPARFRNTGGAPTPPPAPPSGNGGHL